MLGRVGQADVRKHVAAALATLASFIAVAPDLLGFNLYLILSNSALA